MSPSKILANIKSRFTRGREAGSGRIAAAVIFAILVGLLIADPLFLQFLRHRIFDFYQVIEPRESQGQPVVIIDIDEKSLREIGQWPWPRHIMAKMVDNLDEMGAAVIGFDVVFPEPDRLSPSALAKNIPNLDPVVRKIIEAAPDNDKIFAEAVRQATVVMGQSAVGEKLPGDVAQQSSNTTLGFIGTDPRQFISNRPDMLRSLPEFNQAAKGHGLFTLDEGTDGVVRSVPLVMQIDGKLYPALAVEMLRLAVGSESSMVKAQTNFGIEGIMIKPYFIETSRNGEYWVYYSKYDRSKYISAVDVIEGRIPKDRVNGRLALVGTSAVGLLDIKATPINPHLPGVEVHAQIIENVLANAQLKRPSDARAIELIAAVVIGAVFILFVPIFTAQTTLLLALVSIGGMFGGSWYAFVQLSTLYDPVLPSVVVLVLYIFLSYRSFVREEERRQEVRDAFSHYLSPELVQELALRPGALNLGGEMRDMTIMFSDIRRFTSIAERLSAEELTQLINSYLTPMTDIVLQHQGTIDKYIGDCIMAFWNAPVAVEQHPRQACLTALAMENRLEEFNENWHHEAEKSGQPFSAFRIGIGINSGIACVGNIGSEQRFNYSVLGDVVNVSSRLEDLTKLYGVTTILGEQTRNGVDDMALLELDMIRVRGKEVPQKIYVLLGDDEFAHDAEFKALRSTHNEMLKACRSGEFELAQKLLRACRVRPMAARLEQVYNLYDERIRNCLKEPPVANWDGVFAIEQPTQQAAVGLMPGP